MSDEVLKKRRLVPDKFKNMVLDNTIYLVLFLIFIVMVFIDPRLLRWSNVELILSQASTRTILTFGSASIIVLGQFDVSLGRIVGLTGVVIGTLIQAVDHPRRIFTDMPRLPVGVGIVAVILLGGLAMLFISIFVAKLHVPGFIATLAFALVVYGANTLYADRTGGLAPIGGFDKVFKRFAQGSFRIGDFRITYLIIYAIIITAVMWFIWNKTKLGKDMFAIGGNTAAARVCGVNIAGTTMIIFVMAGFLYGFSGALEAGRIGTVTVGLGEGYALDAIAAAIVGGVSLRGGVGRISGIIVGVLIFQLISYGLVFLGVNPYVQFLVKGLIILFAVTVDVQKGVRRL